MRWVIALLVATGCGRENFDRVDPLQGDADGDTIDGNVDNCPHMFNDSQLDTDGDDIGDVCDPHPGEAIDVLAAVGIFSTSFGDFSPDSPANWLLDGGFLTTTPAPDLTMARLTFVTGGRLPTVQTAFAVRDYGAAGMETVRIRAAGSGENVECTAVGLSTRINTLIAAFVGQSNASGTIPGVQPDAVTAMVLTRSDTNVTCFAAGLPVRFDFVYIENPTTTITIEIDGLAAALTYAAVYVVE